MEDFEILSRDTAAIHKILNKTLQKRPLKFNDTTTRISPFFSIFVRFEFGPIEIQYY